jgi:hypothetical protein
MNGEVIFEYIGWHEIANHPRQDPHRYVINFGERSEDECRDRWPALMDLVEERVKPERMKLRDNPDGRRRKAFWWQYGRYTPALFQAASQVDRMLVTSCGATPHLAFAFQPSDRVFAHSLVAFPLETDAVFCALQSRPHEVWARFFGSSLEDRLRYTPSDCFETFPFPADWESHPALEEAGRAYYEHRAELMLANDEGLTKTYNRFHDPDERDPGILELRELHAAMDRAVLEAYGWSDVPTDCEFLLDYEDDEEGESTRRKKPWRYRWPDDVHDEVLARLIELNAQRAAAEERSAAAAAAKGKKGKAAAPQSEELF